MELNGNLGKIADYIKNNGSCRPSDIALHLGLHPGNLTPYLKKLELLKIVVVDIGKSKRERLYKVRK